MKKTCKTQLPALILVFALLILWQMGAMHMDAAYILPSPTQILQKLWELRVPLFTAHLPATMQVTAIGLGISIVFGLGLAILMDASPAVSRAVYPIVITSQTIPTTALAPLFVLWFGYSIWSKVLVTVLKLPSVLPYFFSALKMAVPMSIVGAAIGEWLGAQAGLGYFSRRMITQLDGAGVFAPIVLLSAVAILLVAILGFIEKKVIRWRGEQ